ncbi:MAG: hypothetical protein A3K19_24625 [Lentisphaerae bacterium RIFOXYB12_FULL_65_16]|nr:MAG: hypothetical protein A3K18_17335 [Lentisphaerae bacterium RIFOXYA12_64_32]OGV84006.1 MAG: hypothetical protein A3K19_24625 [Lentisphaerae bacterium RIFOXYB12_FULL_65_16]
MKFLVDAQLPRKLVDRLRAAGHGATHTRDLPLRNRTPDVAINRISVAERRTVVTKDSDFVISHLLRGEPPRLLLISTGNIGNDELLNLIDQNLAQIVAAFSGHTYVELGRNHITIHQ